MKSIRMLFPVFGLLVAVASAGCSGESGAAGGAESASSSTQAQSEVVASGTDGGASASEGFRGGPHGQGPGGPGMLVFAALHEPINLSAAQRSNIEAIVAANKPPSPPAPDPARIAALAAAIRAGNVDNLTPPTPPDATEIAAHQARIASEATALGTLHGILSKDQRAALVSAVLAKMDKGPGGHGDHKGPPDGEAHHGGPGGGRGPMGGLLEGLNLTAQQEATIKAKFEAQKPSDADRDAMKAKFEAMKADREAKLKTFASDDFDATAFVAPPANAANATSGPGAGMGPGHGRGNELAIIVPVLDAAQRDALAKKIEAGPPAHRGPGPQGQGPQGGPPQD